MFLKKRNLGRTIFSELQAVARNSAHTYTHTHMIKIISDIILLNLYWNFLSGLYLHTRENEDGLWIGESPSMSTQIRQNVTPEKFRTSSGQSRP